MFRSLNVTTQQQSLTELANVAKRGMTDERVVMTARTIVQGCSARNDFCELQAIYEAVKHGHARVAGLEKGVRYVSDPTTADFFTGPRKLLDMCEQGACAEDCDGHAALIMALAGSIGFRVGARAYGPTAGGPLTHVYAVALLPKHPEDEFGSSANNADKVVALDTTVPSFRFGSEPPPGRVLTAWIGALPRRSK